MKEHWKDISGFEGKYQISTYGRVASVSFRRSGKRRLLRIAKDKSGYVRCVLCKGGKTHTYKVHRLVANAFISSHLQQQEVNHKNGIRNDNRVENLEWVSRIDNIRHSFETLGRNGGLKGKTGSTHPKSLPVEQLKDGVLIATYVSAFEAHKMTGINHGNIGACCCGNRKSAGGYVWKHKK